MDVPIVVPLTCKIMLGVKGEVAVSKDEQGEMNKRVKGKDWVGGGH